MEEHECLEAGLWPLISFNYLDTVTKIAFRRFYDIDYRTPLCITLFLKCKELVAARHNFNIPGIIKYSFATPIKKK